MFKLDRLELSGFKSFVDPEHLDFSGGITAIVGPNGCGKSNVCDAVCWVLGERSAKNLRGQTMEDVIFGGSKSRKPLGMAEVVLTLTTDSSFEGAEDGRLTIGRRVHRSGESQYSLNGKTVRLKDVRDLLMDTGLGIRAYSVIEQGKIGMILSGKPQERRRLLEEAAGITRYKERKRLAEVKLEEARGNLARLDDILAEVERSLRSLKRQAGAARRFKQRKAAYQDLLQTVLLGRWGDMYAHLQTISDSLRAETDRETELTTELQRLEADLLARRGLQEKMTGELTEHHRLEADLAARIEGKQEFLRGSRARIEEIDERIQTGRAETRVKSRRIEGVRAQLSELEEKAGLSEKERSSAANEVSEDDVRLDRVERLASESERRLEELRTRLLGSIARLNGLRAQLHEADVDHEKNDLRERHLADEFAQKLHDLQQTTSLLEKADAFHRRLADDVRAGEAKLEQIDATMREEEAVRNQLRETHDESRDELRSLIQTREVLEELGRAQDERRAALSDAFHKAGLGTPDYLADRIKVPEGWERSVDLYLGTLADAIIVSETSSAAVVLNAVADTRLTAELVTTDIEISNVLEIEDPAVGASLGEALGLPTRIAAALPPAFLVESADDARRLAANHSGVAFITRDRLWAQSGLLHTQGREARPGTLTREHDLAEAAERIDKLSRQVEKLGGQLAEKELALENRRRQRVELMDSLTERRREFAVAAARKEDITSRHRRLSLEHETLHSEQADIGQTLGLVAERTEQLAADLGRAETLHTELEADFDHAQRDSDKARSERELIKTTGASRRGGLNLLDQRLESLRSDIERTRRDLGEDERSVKAWRAAEARLEERQSELRAGVADAETVLQESLEQRESAQQNVIARQEALHVDREGLTALEAEIDERRSDRDRLRETLGALRVEEAAIGQDREHLASQYQESLSEQLPERPQAPPESLVQFEVDLAQLKSRLESTGPVNLLAAEEFDEHNERHEFLHAQRTDVADSVVSLKDTIREIDQTSSERFMETFLQVNGFFGEAFQDLFRGGQAEMRLLDENDPLDCGLEIVARPPGKRLQNIMLMSGGEKALTAIALLFALFRTKPSPFCILDEVDAPLDDINTLRFVQMLKKTSSDTQFVVITHNKITMEASTRLYGVTMQEPGVSRLVSVELDEIHPETEARATA
ncbi:MAG: chromosome segregation protein SMC [Acidobacteria bacterium]|nr:chromosome segregation protein SMC [Acidobacteriota bacterium]